MTTIAAGARTWRRRDRRTQLLVWAAWLFAVALFVGCFQLISDKTIWAFVWDALQQAGGLAVRMVPPDWQDRRPAAVRPRRRPAILPCVWCPPTGLTFACSAGRSGTPSIS